MKVRMMTRIIIHGVVPDVVPLATLVLKYSHLHIHMEQKLDLRVKICVNKIINENPRG